MPEEIVLLLILLGLVVIALTIRWSTQPAVPSNTLQTFQDYTSFIHRFNKTITDIPQIDIPMYYINMDRSTQRRQLIEAQIKKYSINEVRRIRGVEGNQDPTIRYRCSCNGSLPRCTLSHLRAIAQAYDSGLERVLIVEDDVSFDLLPYWSGNLSTYVAQAPIDWGVLKLFSHLPYDESLGRYRQVQSDESEGYGIAYVIRRSTMAGILAKVRKDGVFHLNPTLCRSGEADCFIYEVYPVPVYHIQPYLVYSTSQTVNLAIQTMTPYIHRIYQEYLSTITDKHIEALAEPRVKVYQPSAPTTTDIVLAYRGGELHEFTAQLDKRTNYRLFVYHKGSEPLLIPKEYIHQHILLADVGGDYHSFAYHRWRELSSSTETIFVNHRGQELSSYEELNEYTPAPSNLSSFEDWEKITTTSNWRLILFTLSYGRRIITERYLAQVWDRLSS